MTDTINDFIKKIEYEFEGTALANIHPDTHFRMAENWSSMHALIMIALAETEYNVELNGADLRSCHTIQDLYELIAKSSQS